MIEKGHANVAKLDREGRTALWIASSYGHEKIVEFLIDKGANVNFIHKDNQNTPLIMAAFMGKLNTVKLLVEKGGANMNHLNHFGQSAIYSAAVYDHSQIVEYLFHKGGYARSIFHGNTFSKAHDRHG